MLVSASWPGTNPAPLPDRNLSGFSLWWQVPPLFRKSASGFFRRKSLLPFFFPMACLFGVCSTDLAAVIWGRQPPALHGYAPLNWCCTCSFFALLRKMIPFTEAQGESLFSIDLHFPFRCLIFSLSVPQVRGEQAEWSFRDHCNSSELRCFSPVVSGITAFSFATFFRNTPYSWTGLEPTFEPFPSFTRTVRAQNQLGTMRQYAFQHLPHVGSVFKEQSECLVALIWNMRFGLFQNWNLPMHWFTKSACSDIKRRLASLPMVLPVVLMKKPRSRNPLAQ